VTVADHLSIDIHTIAFDGNDPGGKRQIGVGQADAIESKLQPALPYEVPWVLVGFKMSDQVSPAGKDHLTKHLDDSRMAKKGIAYFNSCR
jgi:hypothetical protein